jgi:hypothetical protein
MGDIRNNLVRCLLASLILFGSFGPLAARGLSIFSGNWIGSGRLTLNNGKQERIRCRISIRSGVGGQTAEQTVQCASTGRDVLVRSSISLSGQRVSGSWRDQSIGSTGQLSGKLTGNRLRVRMSGPDVSASVTTVNSGKRQSVYVSGRLGPITKLSISLRRR